MCTEIPFPGLSLPERQVKHLYLAPRLRMGGAVPNVYFNDLNMHNCTFTVYFAGTKKQYFKNYSN